MKKFIEFYRIFKEKKITSLSASITFFFIVNGGSLCFLVAFFFNMFELDIPKEAYESNTYLNYVMNFFSANNPSSSYIILILTSIWSSSSLFYHIILAGESIYNESHKKITFKHRIIAIVLVIIFMVMSIVTILMIILGRMAIKRFSNGYIMTYVEMFFLLVVASFVILFFLLFIPPKSLKIKDTLKGYLFTILLWQITTVAFRLYLKAFNNFKAIYGFLTFIIIGMIYIYLLVIGLVIGLVINSFNVKK